VVWRTYAFAHFVPSPAVLRFLATLLPAVGACARGLLAQSESHRMAALSEGLSQRLRALLAQARALPASLTPAQSTDGIELLTWKAVQELISEADTWMRLQASVLLAVGVRCWISRKRTWMQTLGPCERGACWCLHKFTLLHDRVCFRPPKARFNMRPGPRCVGTSQVIAGRFALVIFFSCTKRHRVRCLGMMESI